MLKMWRPVLLLAMVPILAATAVCSDADNGGSPAGALSASFEQASARVGEPVWLTLRYRLPEGARLPETVTIGGLEGLAVSDRRPGPEQIRVRILVDRLDSLSTGPLRLFYLDRENRTAALTSSPAALKVLSTLGENPETASLRPIADILPTRSPWRRYGIWAAVAAGLAIAGALFFRWTRRRSGRGVPAAFVEPPHVTARKEIEALLARDPLEKGAAKAFYFSLSLSLRRYMEAVRNFPAAEMTTEELAGRLKIEADRRILRLLRRADRVKFADTLPTPHRKDADVRLALAYIDETAPVRDTGRQIGAGEGNP